MVEVGVFFISSLLGGVRRQILFEICNYKKGARWHCTETGKQEVGGRVMSVKVRGSFASESKKTDAVNTFSMGINLN